MPNIHSPPKHKTPNYRLVRVVRHSPPFVSFDWMPDPLRHDREDLDQRDYWHRMLRTPVAIPAVVIDQIHAHGRVIAARIKAKRADREDLQPDRSADGR